MERENMIQIIEGDNAVIRAIVPAHTPRDEVREVLRFAGLQHNPRIVLTDGPIETTKRDTAFMDIPKEFDSGEGPSFKMVIGLGIVKK